jgi:hypothetical protein
MQVFIADRKYRHSPSGVLLISDEYVQRELEISDEPDGEDAERLAARRRHLAKKEVERLEAQIARLHRGRRTAHQIGTWAPRFDMNPVWKERDEKIYQRRISFRRRKEDWEKRYPAD